MALSPSRPTPRRRLTPRGPAATLPRMSKEKPQPALSGAGAGVAEVRKARLAAALRENLRKRKALARERAAAEGAAPPVSPKDNDR